MNDLRVTFYTFRSYEKDTFVNLWTSSHAFRNGVELSGIQSAHDLLIRASDSNSVDLGSNFSSSQTKGLKKLVVTVFLLDVQH